MRLTKTLAAMAAATFVAPAANAAVLDLQTDAVSVNVGETFEVQLVVDRDAADAVIAGLQAEFSFTDDTLRFVDGMISDELGDTSGGAGTVGLLRDGLAEAFAFTNELTLESQADSFSIVTLTFEAVTAGRGEVELGLAELFSIDLGLIGSIVADGDINVLIDVNPIPVPAGAVLLLTGLGGLAAARRRS